MIGEKGRDLAQFYYKTPTSTKNSKMQRESTKSPPKVSIAQQPT